MSRLDTKKVLVEDLNKIAQEAFSVIAVDYRGTNVPGLTQLRKEAKLQAVQLKVIKNTLAKRALENTKFDSLNEILTGPTLLAFSMNDFQSAAKLVKDFAAKEESFEVKGLSIGEGFLEPNELKALASLPSKEEAISMLLGLIQAPLNKLAGTLNEVPSQLVRTVNAVSQTKS
ncbi:50S ribosomal protein L10 [Gammaproteobacteria bacterium]|nr:50S ribosomal protein L10 [Gammaproteobacteria bacterium]